MTAAHTEIALVDLSSIAHPLWHQSGKEPDVDWTSQQIVERIRNLTMHHPHAAICCDSGRSFRKDINPTYKANRPEREAALYHQIALAREQLVKDGYPVWSFDGYEADDVIATTAIAAASLADTSVLIHSADKDLLQLVGDNVRMRNTATGVIFDVAAVQERFKVSPSQMCDFLTLVGDVSDNVQGAKGIGAVKAAALLQEFGSLDNIYVELAQHGTRFTPAVATSLREFYPRRDETRQLIALRTDVEIPFVELDAPRRGQEALPMFVTNDDLVQAATVPPPPPERPVEPAQPQTEGKPSAETPRGQAEAQGAVVEPPKRKYDIDVIVPGRPMPDAPAPAEFERQLEPRSLPQAMSLANEMYAARMFGGYGSGQAVLSTILAGRELGLPAIGSLRAFHVIEGKHSLSADGMRALVMRSGAAKYFRIVERTAERATFETWRQGDPEPIRLTYTIEEGYAAFNPHITNEVERKRKWDASAWTKHPADMCTARASSKLARLVYADILYGLYSPEELSDGR